MTEEWRAIPGFPSYEASSLGRIRRSAPYTSTFVGRVLIPQPRKSGYLTVGLCESGKVTRAYIHRLVCSAFNGEPASTRLQAAHVDGTRGNNMPTNLIWSTAKENESHKQMHGTSPRGRPRLSSRKISDGVVYEIRDRHSRGEMQSAIAASVGVSKSYVHRIVHNQSRGAQ